MVASSTAFPPRPPADPDDPASILATDQAAFDRLTHLKTHWDRPGWKPGDRKIYWLATFEHHHRLAATTLAIQEQLRPLGLDPIAPADLHLTLVRVAPTNILSPQHLRRLAATASEHAGPGFTATAHPLTGSTGAIRYSVSPWTPFTALHAALTAANHALGLPGGKATADFRPHLGVAYVPTSQPAAPVITAVTALRTTPPVPLTIDHIDLVELRRENHRYAWTTLHRIALPPQ